MIVMFLVGIIFFLFGASMLLTRLYYQFIGQRFTGKLIGYHKKLSFNQSNKSSQLYYYPLIEYYYKGVAYIHSPYGSNRIDWNIGKELELYKLKGGPEYIQMRSGSSSKFSLIFLLAGVGLIITYLLSSKTLELWELLIPLYFIAVLLFLKIKTKISLAQIKDTILKSKAYKKEDFKDKEVFWKQDQINKELAQTHSVALKVVGILMLCSYTCFAYFVKQVSLVNLSQILNNCCDLNQLQKFNKAGPELFSTILLITSLLFTYSFIYCWKNVRRS